MESGGRGPTERVQLVPFGEETSPPRPVEGPWAGKIPAPYPAWRHPSARVQLVTNEGRPVALDTEAQLTGEPFALAWGKKRFVVTAWAGPWAVDGRWWASTSPGQHARMQVVGRQVRTDDEHAWLLLWRGGRWSVEAVYG